MAEKKNPTTKPIPVAASDSETQPVEPVEAVEPVAEQPEVLVVAAPKRRRRWPWEAQWPPPSQFGLAG